MHTPKEKILHWSLAGGLALLGFFLLFFFVGDRHYGGASDAFFVVGVVELAIAGLLWVTRLGAFDVLNYSFQNFFGYFRANYQKRWDTAYDYEEHMKEKRSLEPIFLLPYLTIGLGYLALAAMFLAFFLWLR